MTPQTPAVRRGRAKIARLALINRLAEELWKIDCEDFRTGGSQPAHKTWEDTGEACEWEFQARDLKNFQRALAKRLAPGITGMLALQEAP